MKRRGSVINPLYISSLEWATTGIQEAFAYKVNLPVPRRLLLLHTISSWKSTSMVEPKSLSLFSDM